MASLYKGVRQLPLAHISIRVPWHDNGWNGTICQKPRENFDCLVLKRIGTSRNDELEQQFAGQSIQVLSAENRPACMAERSTIMAPFEFNHIATHPYRDRSPLHKHCAPTEFRHPAYSAACVPFRWLNTEFVESNRGSIGIAEHLQLGYSSNLEPGAKELGFSSSWVQHHQNQRTMLDTFFGAIRPEESLCFFYAKRTSLSEETGRVLIGVGRVKHIGDIVEYKYTEPGNWRTYLWERAIQHSIRPSFKDGFILPYQQIRELADEDNSINPEEYLAFVPNEAWMAFSYGAEHVSHDQAIAALLACRGALEKIGTLLPGTWDRQIEWIDHQLNSLWTMRGPYPGLGSALKALGIQHGNLIAYEIALAQQQYHAEWTEDPWTLVAYLLNEPTLLPNITEYLNPGYFKVWNALNKTEHDLLKLLSRFELSEEQAERFFVVSEREKAGIHVTNEDLLHNPYLVYELDRQHVDAVSVTTIDRGMFPDPVVLDKYPLPSPQAPEGPLDVRRIRALAVHYLELAATNGHSLQPQNIVIQAMRDMEVQPHCTVSPPAMRVAEQYFDGTIYIEDMNNEETGYQLDRLHETRDMIRSAVNKRILGQQHPGNYVWRDELDKHLSPISTLEPDEAELEDKARQEKAEALQTLFTSRISVLVGPAGTGKTTLLRVLCNLPEIAQNVLLLAPTGKARVRMETEIRVSGAKTIAQYLLNLGLYDTQTGAYCIYQGHERLESPATVIIDEVSMLTEEQLAAVISVTKTAKRLILVGDPRQLPPIGTGRPFVDIVRKLTPANIDSIFPKIGPGYAELTIRRRQIGASREDLLLAEWFGGRSAGAGGDEVWQRVFQNQESGFVRTVQWQDSNDLQTKLLQVLVEELQLQGIEDHAGFETSLGGKLANGYVYFNHGEGGTSERVEAWQILSPVRGSLHGVTAINRLTQATFRHHMKEFANQRWRKIPPPMGPESILYGDKVINVVNQRRSDVWPKERALEYVANSEIGMAVGQFKSSKATYQGLPWKLEVEFASQPGFKYSYVKYDFSDEGNPKLELAYALTVHKTQGSEFGTTFIIIPNPCPLLSREMLYTALTRHRNRLVIFHQGDFWELFRYTGDQYSETARRITNLFEAPQPVPVANSVFLEAGLIHKTQRGELVRSKSEVIIANMLYSKGLPYEYEMKLEGENGSWRLPDFTIQDEESGLYVYWEHLGLMYDPVYKARWQQKRAWYERHGIVPREDGGGPKGILVTTQDDERGGIDAEAIGRLIQDVFGV